MECAMQGCRNRKRYGQTGVSFHRFPQDPSLRALWIKSTEWKNKPITSNTYVCSDHFSEADLMKHPKKTLLREEAVPVENTTSVAYTENTHGTETTSRLHIDNPTSSAVVDASECESTRMMVTIDEESPIVVPIAGPSKPSDQIQRSPISFKTDSSTDTCVFSMEDENSSEPILNEAMVSTPKRPRLAEKVRTLREFRKKDSEIKAISQKLGREPKKVSNLSQMLKLQEPPPTISSCCIPRCPSSQNLAGARWFPIPYYEKDRARWSKAITEKYYPTNIKEGAAMCHKHFDDCFIIKGGSYTAPDGKISDMWRLTYDAIPTIFPDSDCFEVPANSSKNQKTNLWNFGEICRTCSVKIVNEEEKHSFFKGPGSLNENRPDICGELSSFGLKIEEDDNLPQQICQLCLDSFSTLIQFRDQCRRVETKLIEYYEQHFRPISIEFVETMRTNGYTVQPVETVVIDDDDEIESVENEILQLIDSAKKHEKGEEMHIDSDDLHSSNWFCEYYMNLDDVCLPGIIRHETKENNKDLNNTNASTTAYTTSKLGSEKCVDLKSHMKSIHGQPENTNNTSPNIKLKYIQGQPKNTNNTSPNIKLKSIHGQPKNTNNTSPNIKLKFIHGQPKNTNNTSPNIKPLELFKCNLCDQIFNSTSSVQLHKESYHWLGPIRCTICQAMSKTMDDFREHKRGCRKPPALTQEAMCAHCGHEYKTSYLLKQHERRHTGDRPYLCDICGLAFPYKQGFDVHLKGHTDATGNFLCDICDEKLTMGVPEKLLSCKKCGSAHPDSDSLLKHIQLNHIDELAMKCGVCEDEFTTMNLLQEHIKLHSDEKPLSSPDISDELNESFSDNSMEEINTEPYSE